MQSIVLTVLEVARGSRSVLHSAEVCKATVGKETCGIRTFVWWRPSRVLQTESREHLRFRKHLARIFIRNSHDDRIRNAKTRVLRIRQTAAGKRQVAREQREWQETTDIIARFFEPGGETL